MWLVIGIRVADDVFAIRKRRKKEQTIPFMLNQTLFQVRLSSEKGKTSHVMILCGKNKFSILSELK